jgi:hypothetical protein
MEQNDTCLFKPMDLNDTWAKVSGDEVQNPPVDNNFGTGRDPMTLIHLFFSTSPSMQGDSISCTC